MPTDLERAIRDALAAREIAASDLKEPALREPRPRAKFRIAAIAAAAVAVVAVAISVPAVMSSHHRESASSGSHQVADLVGYRWLVTHVVDSKGSVTVPSKYQAYIAFTSDNEVLGNDTVNFLSGKFEPAADGYVVRHATTTLVGFLASDPVHERLIGAVDGIFFQHEGETATPMTVIVKLDDDTLTLRHGDLMITLARSGSDSDIYLNRSPLPTTRPR